jgi:phospholipid/cholesterol/gamma-HCH transport system substrate-binding protein
VGTVADVVADEKGRMEAQANIRRDFFRFVRADSSAVVKKKFGVAGDSYFEITRGEGKPLPERNASILCNEQFQSALEAAVEDIRREALLVLTNVNSGLDTWTKLGADLGETRQHLDQLTVRLEKIAAGVEAGKGTVGKLITDTTLADEAQKLLARANEAMSELQGMVTNLNVAVKNVQNGTARLPEITDAVANETKDLPGLVLQTQTSMRELERLIEAMQRHWLLRKYVNQTNPPPIHPLSEPTVPESKPVQALTSPKNSAR